MTGYLESSGMEGDPACVQVPPSVGCVCLLGSRRTQLESQREVGLSGRRQEELALPTYDTEDTCLYTSEYQGLPSVPISAQFLSPSAHTFISPSLSLRELAAYS